MIRLSLPSRVRSIALVPISILVVSASPAAASAEGGRDPDDTIVVTGVLRPVSRLDASISVSSLGAAAIGEAGARSAAELFRALPGIRSEASGGEGNANIQMRGIPISTGGAKFLQIHEDGLPVLEFGDIQFGNADIFTRVDATTARIEAVRGGSASTLASNSPGGILNLISKTGAQAGGSLRAGLGLDYGEYRLDAEYGGCLDEATTFHVGGFYRVGEGPRRAGYNGNRGGQIRANLTRAFPGGFVRVYVKHLDDRAIAYMPSPVRVGGTDSTPRWSAVPGFRPQNDAVQSRYFTQALTLDSTNRPVVDDIREGMHPVVTALGFAVEAEPAPGWTLSDRFRYADISGRFIAPFTAAVDTAQNLAETVGGAGANAVYANGPDAGRSVPGDALALGVVLFNTRINAFDNLTNDLRLSRNADLGGGRLEMSAGLYASRQTIDMDWLWSSYLLELKGDNAALLDVRNAAVVPQARSDRGLLAYGTPFFNFNGCCRRGYRLQFDTLAPYGQLAWQAGDVNVDVALRRDGGRARGAVIGDGPLGSYDVDGNGTLSVPETLVATLPQTERRPVRYTYAYWSWSLGGSYRMGDGLAVFARYSRGGRANADRYVFGGNTSAVTGALLPGARPVDFVRQAEVGIRYRTSALALDVTGFWARTEEQNYELTSQRATARVYRAHGIELEAYWRRGGVELTGSGTLTRARIVASATPAEVGNRPRRQAAFAYRLAPAYSHGAWRAGFSLTGTTSSYAQDSNRLVLPAFAVINAFVGVRLAQRLQLGLDANNLFNVAGYTEAEEGALTPSGFVRARSINGRTVRATVTAGF